MKQLKFLYQQLKISQDSTIFVTDMKKELMNVLRLIFSSINHLLCIWHINNNVQINCKKRFVFKEARNTFFTEWITIMYVFSDQEYKHLWNQFIDRYNLSHNECINYLYDIYIKDYRRRFVKCYTNQMLHCDTTVTSRDESEHVVLKRQLKSSIDNLKTMMNEINSLFINEQHNYLIEMKKSKMRYFIELRKFIFDSLTSFVTSTALWKILSQYKKLIECFTIISACIEIFITIIELSCSHKIQNRMYEEECLLIKDVHSHWR